MYVSAATMLGVEVTEPEEHNYTEIEDATNVDDHLRNHGFLYVDREFWRLSPAFDINPSPERVRESKTWILQDAGP
jgi:serine/threonine-protein kinase HipA